MGLIVSKGSVGSEERASFFYPNACFASGEENDTRDRKAHDTFSKKPTPQTWFEEYIPNPKELFQGYWRWQTHATPTEAIQEAAKGFAYGAGATLYVAGWATASPVMVATHAGGLVAPPPPKL